MPLNLNYSTAIRNARLDAITSAVGTSGKLRIYDGSQPTNVGTALGAQVLLADLALSSTFAPAASSGVLTANAITADASADATGTAAWGSLLTSANVRVVDFTVGTSSSDMIIDSTSITAGQQVSCSSFVITAGNA
jgi:hypothetical protein